MTILNNHSWPTFAQSVCAKGTEPQDYSPASMERLMREMDPYIVRVKNVRSQFKARNGVKGIDFECEEDRLYYNNALARFEREKAKLIAKEESGGGSQGMCILAQLIIFQMAAETVKVNSIVRAMYEAVTNGNKAAVAALKYKVPISKGVKLLTRRYGVPRDKISLIWGGGNTKVTKKKAAKIDIVDKLGKNAELMKLLGDAGVDMYDLGLGNVNTQQQEKVVSEEDSDLRLGLQTPKERQEEIDRFQRGDSLYCFFTFQAGGVGLSLHHTDELTTFKCRRKESGYVYEEDIPLVPVRSREFYSAVTYNPVQLVQGFGRCPRLTSLSDTVQLLLYYRGTLEETIARKTSLKLKCLQKVVQQPEDWDDIILDHNKRKPSDEEAKINLVENGDNTKFVEVENEDEQFEIDVEEVED